MQDVFCRVAFGKKLYWRTEEIRVDLDVPDPLYS